jgi:mannose-6-phosphate isomerase-like protein (cupin superfamily)
MIKSKFIKFTDLKMESVVAHGGRAPILCKRALRGTDGYSFNFIDCTIVPPGANIGIHTHETDNEEIYIVVKGFGRMRLEGQMFDVGAGDVIINGPGGTHGLENTGDSELVLVVIEIPVKEQERSHSGWEGK